MSAKKPTPTQRALIARFATGDTGSNNPVFIKQGTYEVCRREGWIERVDDVWPYHRVTEAGKTAINLPRDC